MAGATLATMSAATKETWTQDKLESQIYNDNPLLEKLQRVNKGQVGKQILTPILTNNNGGYTVAPAGGSAALNPASNVGLAQAVWNYTHHYQQIKIESAAIDGTDGSELSVASVVDTEVEGGVNAIRRQLTRQCFGNGDSLIAQCTSGGASTTVNLQTFALGGYGYDAIKNGWLYPGLPVDVGTTSSEASLAGDSLITAVSESATAPTITIGTSVTTSTSHYVSIANARLGTAAYEMNGLRNIVSATADLGGLSVSAQPTWKAASVDTTTTVLALPTLYAAQRAVYQKTGGQCDYVVFSPKQAENFYNLLQMQVQFATDQVGAGNVHGTKFAGMGIEVQPDCPDSNVFFVSSKNLFVVQSDQPYWQSKITGGNTLEWLQGSTAFVGALFYKAQLASNRRDSHAAITGLVA